MHKGGKFLKKLWCCVGVGIEQDNLVSFIELINQIIRSDEELTLETSA